MTGMRVVTFKCDEELYEAITRLARLRGTTRSEVIRQAIKYYLLHASDLRPVEPRVVKLWS